MNPFSPIKQKINLVATLVHQALSICSSNLQAELDKIRSVLVASTLTILLHLHFPRRSENLTSHPQHGPKKCLVYLHLSWLENVSTKFEKQITTAIQRCYFVVETRVVFTTKPLLSATKKDVLPAYHHNNVIYQFVCHCDSRYVGRTSQRLQERIKQHVPGPSETIIFLKIALIFPVPARKTAFLKSPPMTLLLDSIFLCQPIH